MLSTHAVFVDRDGTLIREVGYLARQDQIELLPRVPEAIRLLQSHGLKVVMITNQSAVARGIINEQQLHKIHHLDSQSERKHFRFASQDGGRKGRCFD